MKVAGVVLAGGQSKRMGGVEKSLLDLVAVAPIEWVVRRLGPQVEAIAINANGNPARFDFIGFPVIADTVEGFVGPLAGVLAGMRWAGKLENVTHIVTAAADTPFIPVDLVERLSGSLRDLPDDTVAMASSNGRIHPVFGLWPVDLADALEHFLVDEDQRKILKFANRYNLQEIVFDVSDGYTGYDPFFNINTPDDLERARQIAEGLKIG